MTKEQLKRDSEQELSWMKYYGYREDRQKFNIKLNTSIYDQVRSIGYAKVNTPLDLRCNGYLSIKYKEGMRIEDMEVFDSRRDPSKNLFTPLEVFMKLYPDEIDIYSNLN